MNRAGTAGGNGAVLTYSISGNDRYVVFDSYASDLVSTSKNNLSSDVFVRDLQTGTTTLVSVNRLGTASGNGESYDPQISADGRFVVFSSYATDLVENYIAGERGLFVRDLQAGTTTLVVSGTPKLIIDGSPPPPPSPGVKYETTDYHPLISANGRFLAFHCWTSLATNDNDGTTDVYVRDLLGNTTSLASVNATGTTSAGPGNAGSSVAAISADARFVLFVSAATDIVPQQSSTFYSGPNYYVRDMLAVETKLVTIGANGKSDARNSFNNGVTVQDAVMSSDGRFVVFVTRAVNLAAEKANEQFQDIFVRDMVAGTTKVVSLNAWSTASGNRQSFRPRISASGRFVVFISQASDLVYDDNNDAARTFAGCEDIFVRDLQIGVTTLASVNGSGTNSANGCAQYDNYDISGDGRRVVFASQASDLIPNDTNGASDVFLTAVPAQFGQLDFSAASYQAKKSDGSTTITVTRSGASEGSVSIDYATSGGTASSRSNYTPAVGTLHFNPGEINKTFRILITDDQISNGDKSVNLSLSNPAGGVTLGPQKTAVLTIKDDDGVTSGVNLIDDSHFLVRQHYLDFLNREPDAAGFQFWTREIDQCGSDSQCREVKTINVSAAFFLSIEFRQTGFLVYRFYEAAYGRAPTYAEFLADTQTLQQGVIVGAPGWEVQLELNKQMFTNAFADRPLFKSSYESKTVAEYYNALIASTGVTPSEDLLNDFRNGKETRATFFRKMAEDSAFSARQFNPAFVLMQYFGYLRRNPNDAPDSDFSGYNFWLNKLNQFNGDYVRAEMVKAFIKSLEYRHRFGG